MENLNELNNQDNVSSNHLKIGIIGMPNTGKSLFFNLLVSDPLHLPSWLKRNNQKHYKNYLVNFNQNNDESNRIDNDLKNFYEPRIEVNENYLMNLYELDTVTKVDMMSEDYLMASHEKVTDPFISSPPPSYSSPLSRMNSTSSTNFFSSISTDSSINIGNLTGKLLFSQKRSLTSTEFFSTTSNVIGTILPYNNDFFQIYNLLTNKKKDYELSKIGELKDKNQDFDYKNLSFIDYFYCLLNNDKFFNRLNKHKNYLKYYNQNNLVDFSDIDTRFHSYQYIDKILPTEITIIDTPSIISGSFRDGNGLGMNSIEDLTSCDIIIIMIRTFDTNNNNLNIFDPKEFSVSSYSAINDPSHPSHLNSFNSELPLNWKFFNTNSYKVSSVIPCYESNERKLFKTKIDYLQKFLGTSDKYNNEILSGSPGIINIDHLKQEISQSRGESLDKPSSNPKNLISDYELDENFHSNNEINNILLLENELKQRDLYKIEQALHQIEFIFYYQKELYLGHQGETIAFFYKNLLNLWEFVAGSSRPILPKNTYRNKFKDYKYYVKKMEEIFSGDNGFHTDSYNKNPANDKTILSFLDEFSTSTLILNSASKLSQPSDSKPLIDTRTLSSCFNSSNLISPLSLPPNIINNSYKKPLNLMNLYEESPIEIPPFLHRIPRLCKGKLIKEGNWDSNVKSNIIIPLNLLTYKKFLYVVNCNHLDYSRYFSKKMKINQEVNEEENLNQTEFENKVFSNNYENNHSSKRINKNYELYHENLSSKTFDEVINYLESREKKIYGDAFKNTYLSGYPSILPVSLSLEEKNFNIIQENGYNSYEEYLKSCSYFIPNSPPINSFNYNKYINKKLTLNCFSQTLISKIRDQVQSCLQLLTYYIYINKKLIESYGREGITISDVFAKMDLNPNESYQTEVISSDDFINYDGDFITLFRDGKIHIETGKYVVNDRDIIKIVPLLKK